MHTLYLVHSSPQMKCTYSSRPKKVPVQCTVFLTELPKKSMHFYQCFTMVDIGSVYLLVAIVLVGFFVTVVLVEFFFIVLFLAEVFSKRHFQSLCSAAKVY